MKCQEVLKKLVESIKRGVNAETEKICEEILLNPEEYNGEINGKKLIEWIKEIEDRNYDYYPVGILDEMDNEGELSKSIGYQIFNRGQESELPFFDDYFIVKEQRPPQWTFDDFVKMQFKKLIQSLKNHNQILVQKILQSEIWDDVFYETLESSAPHVYFDINFITKEIGLPGTYQSILAQIEQSSAIQEYIN
ncbi:MAG: hypothetical protein PHC89_01155 [Candidatus Pacebacteria bacterium]|nr:hypothetical protein [Candidatus Paceibacterota bacterium]